jgi:hypothetical protein
MSDRDYKVTWYTVYGYGLELYCKITEYGAINSIQYKSTLSFGAGMKKFCVVASYTNEKPNEIYIDRVEKRDICTINKKLSDFEEGIVKFTRIALWTIKQLYPQVNKYTLKDTSQLVCDGEGTKDNMSLSFDYILKYNETWYQSKFNAELPGFLSKSRKNKNSKLTEVVSEDNSPMSIVYDSFKVLDKEIIPLPLVSDILPVILNYKEEYESSRTPREFINKLRKKLGDKYCNIVGKWLNSYMLYLNIDIRVNEWYILDKYIIKPVNYSMTFLSDKNLQLGGTLRRYTLKSNRKYYIMISDSQLTKSFVETNYKDV